MGNSQVVTMLIWKVDEPLDFGIFSVNLDFPVMLEQSWTDLDFTQRIHVRRPSDFRWFGVWMQIGNFIYVLILANPKR